MSIVTLFSEHSVPSVGLLFPGKKNYILTLSDVACDKLMFWYYDKEFLTNQNINLVPSRLNPEFSFLQAPECLSKNFQNMSKTTVGAKVGMEIVLHAPFGSIFKSMVVNTRHLNENKLNSLMPFQIDKKLNTSAIAFEKDKLVGFYQPKVGLICISFLIQMYREFMTKNCSHYILKSQLIFKDNIPRFKDSCIIQNNNKGVMVTYNDSIYGLSKGEVVLKINNTPIENAKEFVLVIRKLLLNNKLTFNVFVWDGFTEKKKYINLKKYNF